MSHVSRRTVMSSCAIICLGGCTITNSGGVIGGTLNVAKISTDGHSIISAITAALAIPPVGAALGPYLPLALGALAGMNAALAGVMDMSGGTITMTVDTTKVQAAVQTLLADAETALGYIQTVIPDLAKVTSSKDFVTQLQLYIGAAQTLLPIVAAAAQIDSAQRFARHTGMDETRALAIAAGHR